MVVYRAPPVLQSFVSRILSRNIRRTAVFPATMPYVVVADVHDVNVSNLTGVSWGERILKTIKSEDSGNLRIECLCIDAWRMREAILDFMF